MRRAPNGADCAQQRPCHAAGLELRRRGRGVGARAVAITIPDHTLHYLTPHPTSLELAGRPSPPWQKNPRLRDGAPLVDHVDDRGSGAGRAGERPADCRRRARAAAAQQLTPSPHPFPLPTPTPRASSCWARAMPTPTPTTNRAGAAYSARSSQRHASMAACWSLVGHALSHVSPGSTNSKAKCPQRPFARAQKGPPRRVRQARTVTKPPSCAPVAQGGLFAG